MRRIVGKHFEIAATETETIEIAVPQGSWGDSMNVGLYARCSEGTVEIDHRAHYASGRPHAQGNPFADAGGTNGTEIKQRFSFVMNQYPFFTLALTAGAEDAVGDIWVVTT